LTLRQSGEESRNRNWTRSTKKPENLAQDWRIISFPH
jgi:hypothetical protein